MEEPIRILQVLGGLSIGGAESRVMDLYRVTDKNKVQFDFMIHTDEEQHFQREIEKLGGRIYRVPRFRIYNWSAYRKAWKLFFAEHKEFRAVHGHMTSTASIYLPIAKKAGIPLTIAHSRSAGVAGGIKGTATKLLRRNLAGKADICLACSQEAGVSAFGKKAMEQGRVRVIPNAISAKKYVYDEKIRKQKREELGVSGAFVVGHVGSFRIAKNHPFILKIFAELVKQQANAVLLLAGDGSLRADMEKEAERLGIGGAVRFLGNQTEIAPFYQCFDCLLFPSLYEGLPGTVVEAQVAGLSCFISDTITPEVVLTDLVTVLSLKQSPGEWADIICKQLTERSNDMRRDRLAEIEAAGFTIERQKNIYLEMYCGEKA